MARQPERVVWSLASQHLYMLRRIERACAANQSTLRAFAKWLAQFRGLQAGTITVRIGSAGSFVDAVTARTGETCARAFQSLTVEDIEDLFVQYGRDHGMSARRSMRSAMRSFLSFAAEQGWVGQELIEAVPSLLGHRLSGLPRGLSEEQLATLLGSLEEGRCLPRDRAVIYLLAVYGVRRSQVSDLQLADIDWRERTIDFKAHKGGKAVRHSLTPAVAQALALYLRHGRPASDCAHIFLRQRLPHVQLNPVAISSLVRARMVRCGLPPRGPHALRHAFATRLLRAGQSIKSIADLLGHRSLDAVAIYAKVDYARLLESAVDWPEVAS